MKLRSTLLFAAASFSASALMPVVATSSAFFAASTVSSIATEGEAKTISGDTTFEESETFESINVTGRSTITINDGVVITTGRYVGGDGQSAGTTVNLNGTMTVTGTTTTDSSTKASFIISHWGGDVDGIFNITGTLNVSSGISTITGSRNYMHVNDGGVVNFVNGLTTAQRNSGGGITINLNAGGRINFGSNGITNNSEPILTLNLNGGTIGILGSDETATWSTSKALTLTSNKTTIDTTIYKMAEDGNSATSLDVGGSITLGISGLTGAGSNLDVTGATNGKVTISTLDLTGVSLEGTHKLFEIDGEATAAISAYTWKGENCRVTASYREVENADGTGKIAFVTLTGYVADLVWEGTGDTTDNGANGNWDTTTKNWTNNGTEDTFHQGDSVTFKATNGSTSTTSVTITENLTARKVSVTSGTFILSSQSSSAGYVSATDGIFVGAENSSDSSATAVLKLNSYRDGSQSVLRGALTIGKGGKVELLGHDATGYRSGSGAINSIFISEGGELSIQTKIADTDSANQTFNMSGGITLKGGKITGCDAKSKFDLFNSSTGITTLASSTTAEISAAIGLRSNGTFTVATGTTSDGVDLLISGMLTNTGKFGSGDSWTKPLTKEGTGTLKLTGDNSYWTAGGTVNAGTLIIGGSKSMGTGGIAVNSSGTLEIHVEKTSTDTTADTTTDDAGQSTGDDLTIDDDSNDNTAEEVADTTTDSDDSTVVSYSGSLTGTGTINITAGTLKLTGTNNFKGTVNVYDGGILDITDSNGKLVNEYSTSSVVSVKAGGEVKVANFAYDASFGKQPDSAQRRVLDGGKITVIEATDETVRQGFTVTENGGTFEVSTSEKTLTLNGNANTNTIALGGALKIGGAGNITINKNASRVAIAGAGSIEKIGAGTLTINSVGNTYSGGTKVSEGTLVVGASDALGTGDVTLAGGTLEVFAGTTTDEGETTGAVTLTFESGKKLIFESGATSTTGDDSTTSGAGTLKGNVTLNGGTLVFADENAAVTIDNVTLTLTSGTIDFSEVFFSEDTTTNAGESTSTTTKVKAMTLFTGTCCSSEIRGSLESLTLVGDSGGTFAYDSAANTITYTASEASLVWKNPTSTTEESTEPEQKWTSTSFSGRNYSSGDKKTFFFTSADGKAQTVTIEDTTDTTTEGEDTTTTTSVVARTIIVDAGENGSYDFQGSENLTVTNVKIKSGTLTVNELAADNSIGTVVVESGATFVLAKDNTGFDSITLNNSTLKIKSTTDFRKASNQTTGGAILGMGTIAIDVGKDSYSSTSESEISLSVDKLANALCNVADSRFTGTISVESGIFNVNTGYPGKFPNISYVVKSGGQITISGSGMNTLQKTIQIAGTGLWKKSDSTTVGTITKTENGETVTENITEGSKYAAAIAFNASVETKTAANVELTADATIYVGENFTGTIAGAVSGATYTLTKTGAGALKLSGTVDLHNVEVSAGSLQIENTTATAGTSKNLDEVSLASGTGLYLASKSVVPSKPTVLNSLVLEGDATLGIGVNDTNYGGHWQIGSISLATSDSDTTNAVSSATLTLKEDHNAADFAVFELGTDTTAESNFSGKIVLNQSNTGGYRHTSLVISSETIAENAEISIGESKSSTSAVVIGINADNVKIAGLSSGSDFANRIFVFSGTIATGLTKQNISGTKFESSWATNSANRTLEINVENTTSEETTTEVEKTFYGSILENLNLSKTGTGTQTLAGTSALFNGAVEVQAGTLKLTAEKAIGIGTASILQGATLEISNTTDFEFDNSVFGKGNLTKTGAGTLTMSGIGNTYSGKTTISEGTLVGTVSDVLGTSEVTISSGAKLELSTERTISLSNEIKGEGDLTKTGTGTATLSKVNTNSGTTTVSAGTLEYAIADDAGEQKFGDSASVVIESGATLEFTGKNITLAQGNITFADKTATLLLGGSNTAVTFKNVELKGSGDSGYVVIASSDLSNKLTLDEGSKLGDNTTLLLKSDDAKVNLEIASGMTITAANVEFTGVSGSEISGTGTLVIGENGQITSSDASNTISVTKLQFSTDGTFNTERNLTISSDEVSSSSSSAKLTKTGTGTLKFEKENALNKYTGSFALVEGKLDLGDGTFTVVSGATFSSAAGTTLDGNLTVSNGGNAALAGAIEGNLTLDDGSNLEFVGEVSDVKTFSWTTGDDGAEVKLSGAFAVIAGKTTLISFKNGTLDGVAMDEDTDFSKITFTGGTADKLIGREVSIGYTETTTGGQLDLSITGALRWDNANFTTVEWVEDDATSEKWLLVTSSGLVSNEDTYFKNGNFLEFYSDADSTFSGQLEIKRGSTVHTTGLQFSGERTDGTLTIAAVNDSTHNAEWNSTHSATIESDEDEGDAGIVIASGSVTISSGVVNNLKGGVYIYGGSLTVSETAALGTSKDDIDGDVFLGEVDSGSETRATLAFSPTDDELSVSQKIVLGNSAATISVADGKTVTLTTALTQAAEAKAEGSTYGLHKTGAGTLKIDRASGLASLIVEGGKLAYTGTSAISGMYASVYANATLDFSESLLNTDTENASGAKTTFSTLRVSGTVNLKNGDTFGAFRANKIDGLGGTINGDLYIGDATEFTDSDDAKHKGTGLTTARGTSLTLVGSVAEYDTPAEAKLYKYGAGTLTLTGKATGEKFSLGADFVHDAGTVVFSSGANVTGNYAANAAVIKLNGTDAATKGNTFTGGFSATNSAVFLLGNKSQTLEFSSTETGIATFSASSASIAFLTDELSSTPNEVKITETDETLTVAFGDLQIGGQVSEDISSSGTYGRVNLTVDAANFSAGVISIGDGSKLTLKQGDSSMTSATATGIYVAENSILTRVVSELDLNGTTLKLTGTADGAVLGGTGTLQISNGTLDVEGKNWVATEDEEQNAPKIILSGDATLNFNVTADGTQGATKVYTNLGGITTANTSDTAKGTISKTGDGTLVIFDSTSTGELTFDGDVTLSAGATELYARFTNADLTIETGATLRFYGEETEDKKISASLSGDGTLETAGTLVIDENSSLEGFTGTLSAGTSQESDAGHGVISYNETLAEWQAGKGDEDHRIVVRNGGTLSNMTTTTNEALEKVDVIGTAIFENVIASNVAANMNSELFLTGESNSISNVEFSAASDADKINEIYVESFTASIGGTSRNLEQIYVSEDSRLLILAPTAVGNTVISSDDDVAETPAEIISSGVLVFSSGDTETGKYANNFTLDGESVAAVLGSNKTVELTGTFTAGEGFSTASFYSWGTGVNFVLPENVLELAGAEQGISLNAFYGGTIALNIADGSEKTLGMNVEIIGNGTFEKLGAGTLTIDDKTEVTKIGSISVADGKLVIDTAITGTSVVGEVSVSQGATLEVKNNASLSTMVLTGEGTATFADNTSLAGMDDAGNVTLTGTLEILGDISSSEITFSSTDAELEFAADEEQTVSGETTLSGETITLVNTSSSGSSSKTKLIDRTVQFDSSTTKLVLNAQTGVTGGQVDAAFSGSLEKIGGGTWTVTDYTFGSKESDALTVSGGKLVWENAKILTSSDTSTGTITIADGGTLSINKVADGDTLNATIGGAGTLEISGGTLTLNTKASDGASWDLVVSNGSSVTSAVNTKLPGGIEVKDSGSVLRVVGQITLDGESLIVGRGATLEINGEAETTGTTAEFTQKASGDLPAQVSGTVDIKDGWFNQCANMAWSSSAEIKVADQSIFEVAFSDSGEAATSTNSATITGSGTLKFLKTGSDPDGYTLGGDLTGFTGTVHVFKREKVTLASATAMFDNAAAIYNEGTIVIAHSEGGTVQNVSYEKEGDDGSVGTIGTVLISSTSSNPKAIVLGENNKTNIDVRNGILETSLNEMKMEEGRISIGDDLSNEAVYKERYSASGSVFAGVSSGAFLRLSNGKLEEESIDILKDEPVDISPYGGLLLSGAFTSSENLSVGSLVVTEKGGSLSMIGLTDIDSDVFVASAILRVNWDMGRHLAGTMTFDDATGGVKKTEDLSVITGTLTLHGELEIVVNDDNIGNSKLLETGRTVIGDGNSSAKITLSLDGTNASLPSGLVILTGLDVESSKALPDILTVQNSDGTETYSVGISNGNLMLYGKSDVDALASSLGNLEGLYNAIRSDETSALWKKISVDVLNTDKMIEELVALSPVSFGSLIEMQSGFASIENDLLRERLEQRRYERAFASDRSVEFKPFINLIGQSRKGDGNGTESANYDISHTGVLAGFDVPVSKNTIFGVSLGADAADAEMADGNGEHKGDIVRLGAYGMSVFDNAYVGFGLSLGAISVDTKRNSGYNGEVLEGETDGNDVNASIIAGLGYAIAPQYGLDISPYVGLDFGYAHTKAFKEKGGKESALEMDSIDRTSVRGKIGATLNWRVNQDLRLGFDIAFSHEFGDTDTEIDATFASGDLKGTAFSTKAYLMDENTFSFGPRADIRIDDTWSVSGALSYESDFEDTAIVGGNLGFRARF